MASITDPRTGYLKMPRQPETEATRVFDACVAHMRETGQIGPDETYDPIELLARDMVSAEDHSLRKMAATALLDYFSAEDLLQYAISEPRSLDSKEIPERAQR